MRGRLFGQIDVLACRQRLRAVDAAKVQLRRVFAKVTLAYVAEHDMQVPDPQ